MKQSWTKRLEHLEAAAAPHHDQKLPEGRLGKIMTAQMLGFALRLGGEAKEELAEAGASHGTTRRAELEEQLAVARSIATALEKGPARRETPTSARTIIPGSLDALLAAVI